MVAFKIGALISLLLIAGISCLVGNRRNDRFLSNFGKRHLFAQALFIFEK